MGTTRRKGVFAFGKQAALGTPLAAPAYALSKVSGGIGPAGDRADLPLTSDGGQRQGQYKQRARGAGTVTVLAHPDALGLLLYEAMGAQAVSGVGPYVHVFTMADAMPVPMTVWDMVGGDWWEFNDVHVQKITLRSGEGDLVYCELDLVARAAKPIAAAPAYTLLEPTPRFKYIGSAVKLEADNATPVAVTNVSSVEVAIDRALDVRYFTSLTPADVIPDRVLDFSAGVVFDESGTNQGFDYLEAAHVGGVDGSGLSQSLPAGSFEVTFGKHPSTAAEILKLESNGANWNYDVARPEADPAGGAVEFDVAGPVIRPSGGGTEVTLTLTNSIVGAY